MNDMLSDRIGIDTRLGFQTAAFASSVLLTLVVIGPLSIGLAVAGTLALFGTPLTGVWGENAATRTRYAALAVAGFLLVLGLAAGPGGDAVASTMWQVAPLAVIVGFLSLRGPLDKAAIRWIGAGILVIIVAIIGVIWLVVVEPPRVDVLELHISAAEIVVDGGNPYTEARAADTSPLAPPGAEVVGYPYPPLTMLVFVASHLLLGDPRWAGVMAVALAALLLARPWAGTSSGQSAAALAVGLTVVLHPALGHIVRQGWTEPIALPLLVGVGLLWRKNPTLAAVLLGLTLGLKQYWIVALPLLFIWSDDFRWKRVGIAGGVAAVSLVPAFLADPNAAWNAMVVALMEVPPRLDSIGFAGIGWDTPFWVVLISSAAAALWMGWRGGSAARFQLALAATLSTAFLLGSQAFVNYWFLIATMAMIAVAVELAAAPEVIEGGSPQRTADAGVI